MRNGIEISYFIPFKLSSDVCGDNGLPVCPNATRILGVGKRLFFINSFICRAIGSLIGPHSNAKRRSFEIDQTPLLAAVYFN